MLSVGTHSSHLQLKKRNIKNFSASSFNDFIRMSLPLHKRWNFNVRVIKYQRRVKIPQFFFFSALLLVKNVNKICLVVMNFKAELTFFFFFLFRTLPKAYGSSQARGQIELQLPAYTTATAMPDLSHICSLHCSSQPHRILNPFSKAGDRTRILMDTSWVCYH